MDKETLIRIAEELHQGAFDAKAYYLMYISLLMVEDFLLQW